MDPAFWHSRWQDGRIGFHQDRPTPLLVEHWPSLGVTPGARVFVPLCGKSLDMVWLAAERHRVLGVELSTTAVRAFFDEHGLAPSIEPDAAGERYRAGDVEIVRGDAFSLDAAALRDCAGVFDRGALIALPPAMRVRYVRELYARLPTGCRGLLITLEYPQHEKAGPPFCVPEAEVHDLYGRDWDVRLLERRDILEAQPSFVAEGVSALHTAAYRLERR
ncbi:MAG TPA: thiopurine S-methyltransferase [Lysobacter sp.]|nr:thiopurine S-methyltransferase [Lysobacter sp.]